MKYKKTDAIILCFEINIMLGYCQTISGMRRDSARHAASHLTQSAVREFATFAVVSKIENAPPSRAQASILGDWEVMTLQILGWEVLVDWVVWSPLNIVISFIVQECEMKTFSKVVTCQKQNDLSILKENSGDSGDDTHWKPMEMFLDVVGDMGVTGKSGNEQYSCVKYSLKERQPGLMKTDQQRITIVNPGADKCVDNGGENRNLYSLANGNTSTGVTYCFVSAFL